MSQRKAKKLRQLYNREIKKQAGEAVANHFRDFIKPKPKYIPTFLWLKLIKNILH